ncbi:MAG: disulfide bond formation protein B, partial [Burkholderiaceae bacterium]|nr:disulfide bond formation protein B [Burkholderiaceae bacterium]
FLCIALWAGLAWLLGSQKIKNTFNIFIILTSFGGVASATYQINVASQQFSCAQTFADIFMTRSGLESALPELFGIYATCADARVTVLGVEYAVWAILLFSLQAIAATLTLYLSCRLPRNPN